MVTRWLVVVFPSIRIYIMVEIHCMAGERIYSKRAVNICSPPIKHTRHTLVCSEEISSKKFFTRVLLKGAITWVFANVIRRPKPNTTTVDATSTHRDSCSYVLSIHSYVCVCENFSTANLVESLFFFLFFLFEFYHIVTVPVGFIYKYIITKTQCEK